MSRAIPLLLMLLMLGGCATTSGTAYYYEGDGDYYYGADSADIVVDSDGPGFGFAFGHGPGYGYGYSGGFGYGYGLGYGYGYGGYFGGYSPWYFGYFPYPWWSFPSDHDNGPGRGALVQRDRALRSSLAARPTVASPLLAKPGGLQPFARTGRPGSAVRNDPAAGWEPFARRSSGLPDGRPTPSRSSAIARPAPRVASPAVRTSAPPPLRIAPPSPPRSSSRKQ